MSKSRQNLIKVWNSVSVWTREKKRGFAIAELADETYGPSERTIRRCIEDLQRNGFIKQKQDGLYYPTMTLQPSMFSDNSE